MMKLTTRSILLAIIFLWLVATPAPAAKESWLRVRSKNFLLVGNASEKEIRRVGAKLEQFRDVFARLMTKANLSSPVPTTVIVFKNHDSYKPYKPLYQGKPSSVAGYFQPGEDTNYITLTTETSADNPYHIIFHEYTHLLINNNVTNAPLWFNEGLAEYYSTFELTDGDRKAFLGKALPHHILLLRERFIPLRDLFAVNHASSLYNERDKKSVFYAESWALLHFLLIGNNGQRRPQLGEFLTGLAGGKSAEEAFQQAFKTDFQSFEKELRQYINRSTYAAQLVTFGDKLEFDTAMQSAPLEEAEVRAHLGDLLLHLNRLDEAAGQLTQALALAPDLSPAHASLGMTLMRQKKYDEARAHLERAVSTDSQNYLAHYYYAYALTLAGREEGGLVFGYPAAEAAKMRAGLTRAIELRPDFADSYHQLAFVNLVTGEQLEEAVGLMKKALALSPGNERYLSVLAQIYLRQQKPPAARQILEHLSRHAADPQVRASSKSLLRDAAAMEAYLAQTRANQAAARTETGEPRLGRRQQSVEDAPPPVPEKSREEVEMEALREALRRPGPGEERLRGELVRIDCAARGVVLAVKAGDRTLRLSKGQLEAIDFTAFVPDAAGQIGCGPRQPATPVVVTFRPARGGKTDGEVVAVEFVPKNFQLPQ